jgi:hypothetical protein
MICATGPKNEVDREGNSTRMRYDEIKSKWLADGIWRGLTIGTVTLALCSFANSGPAFAHAVAEGDKGYIQEITGPHLLPFAYLGAKHMITGYDHLLFLFGVSS